MQFIRFVLFIGAFILAGFTAFSVSYAETDKVVEEMTEEQQTAVIGEKAPNFTLQGSDGESHSLSDFAGKTVVLEWTNHKCPYVQKHYDTGNMQKLQQQATEDGVIWLSVNSSAPGKQGHKTPEEEHTLAQEINTRATARLLDPSGEAGQTYGAKTTPHMFIINSEGTLVYDGAIDDDSSAQHETVETAHNYVEAALSSIRAGEPVAVSQTKPYGCTVKYSNE